MPLRPLHDYIVIQVIDDTNVSSGGIVLPGATKDKPQQGTVLAVGSGKLLDNGDIKTVSVQVGDVVMFAHGTGVQVKVDGKDLLFMREADLLAVVG